MHKPIFAWMLFTVSGCAFSAPRQTSGPALAKEGVQVTLVGQYCGQDTGPDWMNFGLSEIALKLEVSNRTSDEVQIHRDHIQLLLQQARAAEMNTWHADQTIHLASGKETTTSVNFFTPPNQSCADDLRLDLQDAITLRDKPIPLAPIHFIAQSP